MTQPVQWLLTVTGKVPSTFSLLADYGLTSSEQYLFISYVFYRNDHHSRNTYFLVEDDSDQTL
jgi:hypothetical protein